MKKIATLFAFIIFYQFAVGQNLNWSNQITAVTFNDYATPVVSTIGSNTIYSVGQFVGTVDLNPGAGTFNVQNNNTTLQTYIQKMDQNGNFNWALTLADSGGNYVSAIKTDVLGNVYVVGSFETITDFNPGAATNYVTPIGTRDAFILKLSGSGNFLWVKTFGTVGSQTRIGAITVDPSNNIYVIGTYQDAINFNPTGTGGLLQSSTAASSFNDAFMLKLSEAGNFTWVKGFIGDNYMDANHLAISASSKVTFAGTYNGTVDFNPSSSVATYISNNSDDIYIVQLDTSGTFNWAKTIGNDGYENLGDLKIDNSGDVILASTFSDSIDANPNAGVLKLYSAGQTDVMIIKLGSSGIFIWAKNVGGAESESVNSMAIDLNNQIYYTGQFYNTADFDPANSAINLTSTGDADIYIASLRYDGQFRMARRIGGVAEDNCLDIAIKNNDQLFGFGSFKDTVDFNPSSLVNNMTALSSTGADIYNFKWDLCAITVNNTNAYHCDSFLFNGTTYTQTGVYNQIIPGTFGCDNVQTLTLTIGNTNTHINHTECNGAAFTYNGQTYTSSGIYTQNYTNQANCDSNTIIHLTYGAPSSSIIVDTSCDFYYFGNQILFSSGTYTNTYTNASGCDSTVTLNLVMNYSMNGSDVVNTCSPYTYNGQTFTTSGMYTNYFVSATGCDSIIDLYLTINSPTNSILTDSACNEYIYQGQTYNTSGNYIITLVNAAGCDSLVNLILTIQQPNYTVSQAGATITSNATTQATYQWINCDTKTPINGATNQSYTAIANGNYAVIVTQYGCTDTSACKTVNGLKTNDMTETQSITLSPNPTSNFVHLSSTSAIEDASFELSNMQGQIMFQKQVKHFTKTMFDLSNLPSGTYMIKMRTSKRTSIFKVSRN